MVACVSVHGDIYVNKIQLKLEVRKRYFEEHHVFIKIHANVSLIFVPLVNELSVISILFTMKLKLETTLSVCYMIKLKKKLHLQYVYKTDFLVLKINPLIWCWFRFKINISRLNIPLYRSDQVETHLEDYSLHQFIYLPTINYSQERQTYFLCQFRALPTVNYSPERPT